METKKIIKKVSEEDIQGNYIYITKKYNGNKTTTVNQLD